MSDNDRQRNLLCKGGLGGLHTLDPHYVYLAAQNAELTRANADLSVKVEIRDEALCLYSEVVRLYQEQELVRPREVDSLLARIWARVEK